MARQITTDGGREITLERYAQVVNGKVQFVTESETDPDGAHGGGWVLCPDNVGDGFAYDAETQTWTAPPAPVDPTANFIDIGPLYDRFGAAKMAVLTSADAGVKAIVADLAVRKWVDLDREDVATSVAYIGSKVAAVTPELQAAVLAKPVAPTENLALRKLFFS